MNFKPEMMEVKGEINIHLPHNRVVEGRVRMDEKGHVALTFDDPDLVATWLKLALDGALIGVSVGTLHTKPYEEPRSDGMDFLQEKDGQTVWFHKCRLGGDITLPGGFETCPHCKAIQITRRTA